MEPMEIRTSDKVDDLFAALVTAQALFTRAKADCFNSFHKSWYADMASIDEATREGLQTAGLAVLQFPMTRSDTITRSHRIDVEMPNRQKVSRPDYFDDGTPVMETVPIVFVIIRTRVVHASGQWMECDLEIPVAMGNRPAQAVGSVIAYGCRYAKRSILGVSSEENDDDGNSADGLDNYGAGRREAPNRNGSQGDSKPPAQTNKRPDVDQPKRPQGIEGRVQFHINRFNQAPNVEVLRNFYEACGAELDGKMTDEQTQRVKKAKDDRRDYLKAAQDAPDPEAESQEAPPIEEENQAQGEDELIEPRASGFKF